MSWKLLSPESTHGALSDYIGPQ